MTRSPYILTLATLILGWSCGADKHAKRSAPASQPAASTKSASNGSAEAPTAAPSGSALCIDDASEPDLSAVNYRDHVAPIFREKCVSCHNNAAPGGISLETYDAAKLSPAGAGSKLALIVSETNQGLMPPPPQSLNACEKRLIAAWVDHGAPVEPAATTCGPTPSLSPAPARLLSNREYTNALTDLFGADAMAAAKSGLAKLPRIHADATSFDSGGAHTTLEVIDAYAETADEVSAFVSASSSALTGLAPCLVTIDSNKSRQDCVAAAIDRLGLRAFRRPVSASERERLQKAYDFGFKVSHANGIRFLIKTVLLMPPFLYHLELNAEPLAPSTPDQGRVFKLSAYELAERIAFLGWESIPDQGLLDAAASGDLLKPAVLRSEVERVLSPDSRARATIDHFTEQWLQLDAHPSYSYSPAFAGTLDASDSLRTAARQELLAFVGHQIWDKGAGFSELMTSRAAYIESPALATIYGVPDVPPNSAEVQLPAAERAGVLTRVATLASGADTYSPILRGVFLRREILCDAIPPPPPSAGTRSAAAKAAIDVDKTGFADLADALTKDGDCKGCHASLINPLGRITGNYDALGRFVLKEAHYHGADLKASLDINPKSTITIGASDVEVKGLVDLSTLLANSDKAKNCFAKQAFRFATGRVEAAADTCFVQQLQEAIDAKDGGVRAMLVNFMTSPQFGLRKVAATPEENAP